ncbi:hypothetical protein HBI56_063290 [Parastagonospora nodorum]|nr:hypothetical protein HBI95_187170 [Parastagonospora nodorum]KAH4913808.1 hypothetical protein HBH74_158800 [Parastagonospora nodorum]KAH4916006.1 hypothetical protein HBH73_237060 [Parastagonospora nodorum]KAH5429580.1 hypothetical protein HBI32_072660 [Parastagonospora nodorum]KAH5563858.1 hypothetical protein HBI25_082870 [Parastagonospora nodorum]
MSDLQPPTGNQLDSPVIESGTLPSLADNTQVSQCGEKLDFTSISSKTFKVEEKA